MLKKWLNCCLVFVLLLNPLFKINVKAEDALHLNEGTNIEELIFEEKNLSFTYHK